MQTAEQHLATARLTHQKITETNLDANDFMIESFVNVFPWMRLARHSECVCNHPRRQTAHEDQDGNRPKPTHIHVTF